MPNYCQKCLACGHLFEEYRPLASWDQYPKCEKCGEPTEKAYVPNGYEINSPAIVVFKAPDGTFRFPGDTTGSAVGKYERLGYERIEAKGWAEVRRLEGRLNKHDASEIRKRVERQCEFHEQGEKIRRSEFFNGMANSFRVPVHDKEGRIVGYKSVKMSPMGRQVALTAVDRNNAKGGPRVREGGGHFEAFSYDRSNREPSRDERGHRHRD